MEKENFLQKLIGKAKSAVSSKTTYQAPPRPQQEPLFDRDKLLYALMMNESGVIPEKDRYTFSQFSGKPELGDALGTYQVTENELEHYSPRYLGTKVTRKEFLDNPGLQDTYVLNKFKTLMSKDKYTLAQVADIHNKGIQNSSDPGSDVYQNPKYANDFINSYNNYQLTK